MARSPSLFTLLLLLLCAFQPNADALYLPGIGEKVVTHATSAADVRNWLDAHCIGPCVLGFDSETRPCFRKGQRPNPPAVVQLSTDEACLVAQIHVSKLRQGTTSKTGRSLKEQTLAFRNSADSVRGALIETLADPSVLLAGVGIDDDAIDMWQFWGMEVNGRVELGGGASQRRGLARLLADATGIALPKSASVQKSDWAASPLTEQQVMYAAADAWAGRAIYKRLVELDAATFGYDAVSKVVQAEYGCHHLYAYRCARQATKAALAAVAYDLDESGLPNLIGGIDAEQQRSLKKRALRKLSEARSKVSKQLAAPTSTELPVAPLLEKNAFAAMEELEAKP